MAMCLVDVLNEHGNVIHTFPITLEECDHPGDDAYISKALKAAAYAHLAPDNDIHVLSARMHVSRSGHLEPYGDTLDANAQTKTGLEQEVRDQAYLLWEKEGSPEGQAKQNWSCALEQSRRERAYVLWQLNGCPEGSAESDWQQVSDFEAQ